MFWIVVIVVCAIIATSLDSVFGKIAVGSAVVAIGLLLLSWITSASMFITLAKICAAIIVITIVVAILTAIIN